ncbi:MAG: hypothetical protein VX498_04690 [Myxococcota bacterium]|nr:hypothetical protein [Myxococcota bacterium]
MASLSSCRSFLSVAAAMVALLSFGGCGAGDEPMQGDPMLVALGERSVGFKLFLDTSRGRTAPGEFPRSGSGFEAFRDRLVRDLAVEEILLMEAERRSFELDDSDIEGARLQLVARVADETLVPGLLYERYGGEEAWAGLVRRRLLSERAEAQLREELSHGIVFDAPQMADGRLRFREQISRPARLRATQIFSVNAETIREAEKELSEGASFEEVAGRYGGVDMGWMSAAQAPELLTESTAALPLGGHTKVLRSPLGYHIFAIVGREPAARLTGERARTEIERMMREEAIDRAVNDWLAQRSEALKLTVHEANVDEVRCCRRGLPYWGRAQQDGAEE